MKKSGIAFKKMFLLLFCLLIAAPVVSHAAETPVVKEMREKKEHNFRSRNKKQKKHTDESKKVANKPATVGTT